MKLLINVTTGWNRVSVLADLGDERTYYLAEAPRRAILVCRNGLKLPDLRRRVVEARVGWDEGMPGFARVPGEKQSKITIFSVVNESLAGTISLSEIIQNAPRDE